MFEGGGEGKVVLFISIDDSRGSHGRAGTGWEEERGRRCGDSLGWKRKRVQEARRREGGGGGGEKGQCSGRSAIRGKRLASSWRLCGTAKREIKYLATQTKLWGKELLNKQKLKET